MRIYIDCEWNGFGGELLSVALVAANGTEFYGEVEFTGAYDPWVAEHVVPLLFGTPITWPTLQERLRAWLGQWPFVEVVADWPEDLQWFCRLLITGPGKRLDTPPLTLIIVRCDAESEHPHNALWDARGLRRELEPLLR